jgi:adenosylcobyric acid synthase
MNSCLEIPDALGTERMPAQSLFVGGTSSNAGKSFVVTAICASLRRQGIAVAPFRAEHVEQLVPVPRRRRNRAGAVAQAQASGLEPETAMNPILLSRTVMGPARSSSAVACGRRCPPVSHEQFDVLLAEVLAATISPAGSTSS